MKSLQKVSGSFGQVVETFAKRVLFGGVGPLWEFRYEAIRSFARNALHQIGKSYPTTRSVACTIHGPGYGLDESEAFRALLAGLLDGFPSTTNLEEIQIVELDSKRASRLKPNLEAALVQTLAMEKTAEVIRPNFSTVGRESESKARLFVAMPFREEFEDEYHIAFEEASRANEFLCERADLASFTGDIMAWVRQKIETSSGLIALMNTANANVFLEIWLRLGARRADDPGAQKRRGRSVQRKWPAISRVQEHLRLAEQTYQRDCNSQKRGCAGE